MTQVVLNEFLGQWREVLKQQWESGNFQSDDLYQTSIANAEALAKCRLLKELIELDFDQVHQGLTDE